MTDYGQGRMFTEEHQDRLTRELAERAEIDMEAAARVLDVLHIHKLDENLTSLHRVLSDDQAVNALGLARETALRTRETLGVDAVQLDNLRLAVKPVGLSGIMV